jgi:hypothetical protein
MNTIEITEQIRLEAIHRELKRARADARAVLALVAENGPNPALYQAYADMSDIEMLVETALEELHE